MYWVRFVSSAPETIYERFGKGPPLFCKLRGINEKLRRLVLLFCSFSS